MNFKPILLIIAISFIAGCESAGSPRKQGQNDVPVVSEANVATFTGKISSAHGKGGFANPHLVIDVSTDDGNSSTFYLMKDAMVTEADGRSIEYMSNVQNGRKVEIRYVTIDGQKRVVSMHYLE